MGAGLRAGVVWPGVGWWSCGGVVACAGRAVVWSSVVWACDGVWWGVVWWRVWCGVWCGLRGGGVVAGCAAVVIVRVVSGHDDAPTVGPGRVGGAG